METQAANARMVTKLMFRLLPIQILLGAVGAVNGIVSSLFASNYVGVQAMSAVALYDPITKLLTAVSGMLVGGATILCGRYIGKNEQEKVQNVFSLDILISVLFSALVIVALLVMGLFGLTGFFTRDAEVGALFHRYLLGQAIGILPFLLGNQLSAFLSLENKTRITTIASLVYIAVNIVLNFLFVQVLRMEAFGLALASSLGMWVFFAIQARYFFTPKTLLRFSVKHLAWGETGAILKIGVPGALSNGYQAIRGLIVNALIGAYVGSVGLSAFGACNNFMSIFWSLPIGMLAVSRMMISVSVGEEDRQTLTDVMRVMFRRFVPLMCVVCAAIILCARPLTELFYRDPAEPVYMMTVWGFRILPLCMPLSIIYMHFVCYGQTSGKHFLVHLLSLLDGVVCVAGFTALLIPFIGMNSAYCANVLNGVVTTIVIVGYAVIKNRRFPRDMEELMVIPKDFGVPETERMDLTVRTAEEVVTVARQIQSFCLERGIDARRAYLAGLSMEEMAGNVVDHGFRKDRKKHSVDVRVVHKEGKVILRVKDDCVPFDPQERRKLADPEDLTRNIGLRMIFGMAEEIDYQSILGMNVLTIRI